MSIPKIYLKTKKDQSIRRFHPWVFSGAIKSTDGTPENGGVVEVYSNKGGFLGVGHYSPGTIAVRIFAFEQMVPNDAFWLDKLKRAYETRKSLGLVDAENTNIYRLVHAEGDGMPGLIIDMYNGTAVIQSHSIGMHQVKPALVEGLKEVYGSQLRAVYDKSAGTMKKNGDFDCENGYLYGEDEAIMEGLENDCRFNVNWITGQKTGFFIDQRDNRELLGKYAKGKKVLNTFCYSGGFSVYALKQGAALVHSLDSSQKALDLTQENIELGGFDQNKHANIKADAVEYMKELEEDYDIIILDPPAFAKHMSARHKAVQGYKRLNANAIRQIKPGGIIFTFSCSQAVDKQMFNSTIMAAAIQEGRKVQILHQLHQPADHPINIFHPEGEYLKGLVIRVE